MDRKMQHDEAKKGLEKQTSKILAVSNAKHPNVNESVNVRFKLPKVDRAKIDARSILTVDISKTDNDFYKPGATKCVLKQLYSRFEFSVCKERYFTIFSSNKTNPRYGTEFQEM